MPRPVWGVNAGGPTPGPYLRQGSPTRLLRKTVNRIRELRQRRGWSARRLADAVTERTGETVSASSVLKIEKGDVPLDDRWRGRLAAALGVEAADLERAADDGPGGIPLVSWSDYVARRTPPDAPRLAWRGPTQGLIALPARESDVDAANGILQGDLLIVRLNPAATGIADGDTVVALDDDGVPFLTRIPTDAYVAAQVIELRRPMSS